MRTWGWVTLAVSGPIAAGVGWILRDDADFFESAWGRGVAPAVAHVLGVFTGPLPFSFAEVGGGTLAIGLLGWLGRAAARGIAAWRRGERSGRDVGLGAAGVLARLLAVGSGVWAWFLLSWGYAAHRHTVGDLLGYPVSPAPAHELGALLDELVVAQDDARARISEVDGVATMRGGVPSVLARAGWAWRKAGEEREIFRGDYGRPKAVFFSYGLTAIGLLGIYTPYTGEANVNVEAPIFSLPASACHEMAHQRGFAREDEANFLSYLVARDSGDVEFQYSVLFFAVQHTAVALADVDVERAAAAWDGQSAAVKRDRARWKEWLTGHQTVVTEAARAVNDTYLKTQGAADGVQSYGRMVDLLIAERRTRTPPD